jgi:hypothetical protein
MVPFVKQTWCVVQTGKWRWRTPLLWDDSVSAGAISVTGWLASDDGIARPLDMDVLGVAAVATGV